MRRGNALSARQRGRCLVSKEEALATALHQARTTPEVLTAVARAIWHNCHDCADCPDDSIPTPEALCAGFDSCGTVSLAEANELLHALCGKPQKWTPSDLTGTAVPAVHAAWCSMPETDRPRHPLAPLVWAWQNRPRVAEPFRPKRRASLPRIHRMSEDEAAQLPAWSGHGVPAPRQLKLPGFAPLVAGCPSWLLWMFDAAGGESMTQGRGAPWSMRLFVGALLHLAVGDRDGHWRTLRLPTEEVINWLHPNGWANRRRDWERFPAALDAMRERLTYVPMTGLGSVAIMFPSVIPRAPSDPLVEFTLRISASAAHGARIDWQRLCRYGTESAVLYRAYLSVCAYLDRSARAGHPITAEIGVPILLPDGRPKRRKGGSMERSETETMPNPAARYVAPLTEVDLAQMIGFDGADRFRRRDARVAYERLNDEGVIDLHREGAKLYVFGTRLC